MAAKSSAEDELEFALNSWGQVSAYLLRVERHESWKASARTYTEWVKGFAQRRGCTPTLLWRYKSSGKFYEERRRSLAKLNISLPQLSRINESVSAEAVEILAKLTRVAPLDIIGRVEVPTLKGEIEKKEVRALWDVYSPLLEGKTARGRGVEAPTVAVSAASRAEADILLGLKRSKGAWLPENPAMFEVYLASEVLKALKYGGFYGVDILIISRADRDAPVVIHGVEVKIMSLTAGITQRTVDWLADHVDRAWLATPEKLGKKELRRIPSQMGVLHIDESGYVAILREANPLQREKTSAENLARDLLARSLRWWK